MVQCQTSSSEWAVAVSKACEEGRVWTDPWRRGKSGWKWKEEDGISGKRPNRAETGRWEWDKYSKKRRGASGFLRGQGDYLGAERTQGIPPAHVELPESQLRRWALLYRQRGPTAASWAQKCHDGKGSLADEWRERVLDGLEGKEIETKETS